MDSVNRPRPALPPIQFLDSEKFKREELDYQTRHNVLSAASVNSSTAPSPIYQHPVGPPPPYSNLPPPSLASIHASVHASHLAEPRNCSGEEKDQVKQQSRQSLPSLQEALGVEQPVSHPSEIAAYTTSSHPPHTIAAPSSPPMSSRATHAMEPPPAPHNPYVHTPAHAPYASQPRTSLLHDRSEPVERRQSEAPDHLSYHTKLPTVEGASRSPRPGSAYRVPSLPYPPPEPSAVYDSGPQSSSMPAPPRMLTYGYTPYPPTHFTHGPPPSSLAPSIYQPSVTHSPPTQSSALWRAEGPTPSAANPNRGEPSGSRPYGESVKRHLDLYDFEAALNEVAEHSTVMLDFTTQYGARLHQTQRTGPLPGTLPAITEIDDLANRSRQTMDALNKMREVLVAQQAVLYHQQAQEQRFKSENENKRNDSVHQSEEGKNGSFIGGDAKKRRGRAAAPGRCHSCNRAETPEWRRGPDGARTLCNACGLHYAKLTRKAGANKAAIGSSNLRPKSRERESEDA